MHEINELNQRYGTAGRIAFRESAHGTVEAVLVNGYGSCEISLYGGQILNYRPMGHVPALFISKESEREAGKQIRGGIPLCWPWFGAPPSEDLPRHGFARLMNWEVLSSSYDSKASEIIIGLQDSEETLKIWPHKFELVQKITLTDNLSIEVSTLNTDNAPFEISQSIHPYFKVRDVSNTSVIGLEELSYTDLFSKKKATQSGPLSIDKETYYIYDGADQSCAVHDTGMGRDILLTSSGMNKLVVWNPWEEKSKQLQDFGDEEYKKMITVAPFQSADTPVTLKPGEKVSIKTAIQVILA